MQDLNSKGKRIVLIHWKTSNEVEVFSNLKNFCLSYPRYNYNTLNNYLSKGKVAYENETIRVERKYIIAKPKANITAEGNTRSIVPVLRKVPMKDAEDDKHDLQYWITQPVFHRVEAVTFFVSQMLKKGERMDKTLVNKEKMMK